MTFGFDFSGRGAIYFQELHAGVVRSPALLVLVTLIVTAGLTIFVTRRRQTGLRSPQDDDMALPTARTVPRRRLATAGISFAYSARFRTRRFCVVRALPDSASHSFFTSHPLPFGSPAHGLARELVTE
jgi:hypothetical protein